MHTKLHTDQLVLKLEYLTKMRAATLALKEAMACLQEFAHHADAAMHAPDMLATLNGLELKAHFMRESGTKRPGSQLGQRRP